MKTVFLFLTLLCCTPIFAQTTFGSLQNAIDKFRASNPSLEIEQLNTELSNERLKSAWSALLPYASAFGSLDNNVSLPVQLVPAQLLGGAEGEFLKVQFGTQYTSTFGAEAGISLINVSNWKNIRSAELGRDIASHQQRDRELSLTEQLIMAYYYALLSREADILNRELITASDSLLSAAQVRLENGMIEPLEFNRVKALYLETVQNQQQSQSAYEKNLEALKTLCAIPKNDTLVLTESVSLQPTALSSRLTTSATQLPRYKMLSLRVDQSRTELMRTKSKALPELSMFARYSRQSFSNQFEMFGSDQPWFDVGVVGFRAEWKIFTGLSRQSQVRQSALQLQIAEKEFANYKLVAEKELNDLTLNHGIAKSGLDNYLEHFQLNTLNHNIAVEKYSEGIYSIDQYINIYQERVRSQNLYLNALANYMIYESMIQTRNQLN